MIIFFPPSSFLLLLPPFFFNLLDYYFVLKLLLYFALLVIVVLSYNHILLLFYQYNYVNIRATTTQYACNKNSRVNCFALLLLFRCNFFAVRCSLIPLILYCLAFSQKLKRFIWCYTITRYFILSVLTSTCYIV